MGLVLVVAVEVIVQKYCSNIRSPLSPASVRLPPVLSFGTESGRG